jgi:DNA-binding transcriptional regulator GbsR (MarR family)
MILPYKRKILQTAKLESICCLTNQFIYHILCLARTKRSKRGKMSNDDLPEIKQTFVEGLSSISQFWGLPKGMGAIFAVLYLAPQPLSLDEIVEQAGLTKGSISTNVRALSRMGLIHPITRFGDRKDYYEAETDFYKAIRAILKERQNSEFDRAVDSVKITLKKLETGGEKTDPERAFVTERVRALNSFFNTLDNLFSAISRLEHLGQGTIQAVLSILR